MTILFVATVAGTIERFLLPYAAHLRSLGWRVEAAAAGVSGSDAICAGFDLVHELPLSRSLRNVRAQFDGMRETMRILDRSRPDLVHVHTPIASFATRLTVRRMPREGRPAVIYTAHGFHFHEGGRVLTNGIYRTAERVAGRWTDRLIVINDEDEMAARRLHIVPSNRLIRMPGIGLDTVSISQANATPGAAQAARRRFGIADDAALFAIVGELNANKRQADAIEGLAAMREETAHLVLIGVGPMRADLERRAVALGVGARTHFVGQSDDVPGVLNGATALISASAREGLSRSVMEALAMGLPVIASSARGNQELVADSGFIVHIGDIVGLGERMDWMLQHPAERREMGERGRVRMVDGYDIRDLIRRHEALYRAVLRESDRPLTMDNGR